MIQFWQHDRKARGSCCVALLELELELELGVTVRPASSGGCVGIRVGGMAWAWPRGAMVVVVTARSRGSVASERVEW